MLNLSHKKLDVWKQSISFVTGIYKLSQDFPKYELYGLTSQLRRAAVSISSNISEGASRSSAKERVRFYQVARSSLVEIDTQLVIAEKLGYCTKENLDHLSKYMNHLFAMLTGMINKTKQL